MSNANPEELVEEAKKPGVFNIISALRDRAYPTETVNVYLDEHSAYIASKIEEEINALKEEESKGGFILDDSKVEKLNKLESNLETILKKLEESKCEFTITGISEGKRDELLELAEEKFPKKFEEEKNPFTGEVSKKEVENINLKRLFTDLLWASHITKITEPGGNVQNGVTEDDVRELRNMLPLSAMSQITEAIEKIRVSTALFMIKVDEDFLAKS